MEMPKSKNGYCPVCKRRLTTPESIERGIGPKCEKRLLDQSDNGSEQLDLYQLVESDSVLTDEHKAINQIAAGIEIMDEDQPEIASMIAKVQQTFNGMMTGQCDVKKALKAESELKKSFVTLANQVEEVQKELEEIEYTLKQDGGDQFTAHQVVAMIRRAMQDGANIPR